MGMGFGFAIVSYGNVLAQHKRAVVLKTLDQPTAELFEHE